MEKITRLLEVEWNVGRTGIIAPRGVLEPVVIDGSTITYATLHNPADITRRACAWATTSWSTAPATSSPASRRRSPTCARGTSGPSPFPSCVRAAGSDIDTSEERWCCAQGRNRHLVASLAYAAGPRPVGHRGSGHHPRRPAFVEAGLVADLADLFTLRREELLGLDRMGDTSTDNLLAAIARAKEQPAVAGAVRARRQGYRPVHVPAHRPVLRDHGPRSRRRCRRRMRQVEGIGSEKAPAIVAEVAELAPLIDKPRRRRRRHDRARRPPPQARTEVDGRGDGDGEGAAASPVEGGPLAGMRVVVTGAMTGNLEKLSRNEMNELIERAGGRSSSSVSKKTSLVVAGEGAGSKRAKAEQLGVRLATPDEFATLVAGLVK